MLTRPVVWRHASLQVNTFSLLQGELSAGLQRNKRASTSTCEAEYVATCLATKESIWLSRLLCDLRNKKASSRMTILVDNQGAIDTGNNNSINQRNKHIDIPYHFVRDCVLHNKVLLKYCLFVCKPNSGYFHEATWPCSVPETCPREGYINASFLKCLVRGGVLK